MSAFLSAPDFYRWYSTWFPLCPPRSYTGLKHEPTEDSTLHKCKLLAQLPTQSSLPSFPSAHHLTLGKNSRHTFLTKNKHINKNPGRNNGPESKGAEKKSESPFYSLGKPHLLPLTSTWSGESYCRHFAGKQGIVGNVSGFGSRGSGSSRLDSRPLSPRPGVPTHGCLSWVKCGAANSFMASGVSRAFQCHICAHGNPGLVAKGIKEINQM